MPAGLLGIEELDHPPEPPVSSVRLGAEFELLETCLIHHRQILRKLP